MNETKTKTSKILKLLDAEDRMNDASIARKAGCSRGLVGSVRRRAGIQGLAIGRPAKIRIKIRKFLIDNWPTTISNCAKSIGSSDPTVGSEINLMIHEGLIERPSIWVELTCKICSKTFIKPRREYIRQISRNKDYKPFCSRRCMGVNLGKNRWEK